MNYVQLKIKVSGNEELTELLIAQLASMGFDGFEESGGFLMAYISQENYNVEDVAILLNELTVPHEVHSVAQQNWNAQWEANFSPVIVDDFVAIRANFHTPITTTQYEIVITPKMSFGTGHHATTYLMLQLMASIDFQQKSVFDFGTGTGILAIMAEKLGATKILAVDCDEWSITNSSENFEINNIQNCTLQQASTANTNEQFNIILANVNRNIILENLQYFVNSISANGLILLSGLLVTDVSEIEKVLKQSTKCTLQRLIEKDGWVAMQWCA